MERFDVVIVGAGIAGASLGARLSERVSVLLIEAEDQPGYHTSGRSAAFWQASYGGPAILPLSLASEAPLREGWPDPTGGAGWLRARGALHLVASGESEAVIRDAVRTADPGWREVGRGELENIVPGLSDSFPMAIAEPSTADIDTAGILGACLAAVRRNGGRIDTRAGLGSATRVGDGWIVETSGGNVRAGWLVDAAGAWGDEVALRCGVAPVGLKPTRRTVVQLRIGRGGLRDLPLLVHEHPGSSFYIKGEGDRRVWVSPMDQSPDRPCDSAPDEEDVATAIDRFQRCVDWPIEAVERRWSGLRTFAGADEGVPRVGPDPDHPGFAWAVGLGGWGFQTAPALSAIGAAAILGEDLPSLPGGGSAADYLLEL